MESVADTIQERLAHEVEGPIGCPLCGNESWTSYRDVAIVETQKPGQWRCPGSSIGAVGAFCNRCGFIRLHAISRTAFTDLG